MTDTNQSLVQTALGSFMTLEVVEKHWKATMKLKRGSRKAAEDAGADPRIFSGYVQILGVNHDHLKRVVKRYTFFRNEFYRLTLRMTQTDGPTQARGARLIAVCEVPDVLARLEQLKAEAEHALDQFMEEYDRLRQIAVSSGLGDWADEVRLPPASEVRGKFYIEVKPPQPLPAVDLSHLSLPADLANRIAERNASVLRGQLEAAKLAAIDAAKEQMEALHRQLTKGERLSPRLVEACRRTSRQLRQMVEGYDRDPRALTVADMIDEQVRPQERADNVVKKWKDPYRNDRSNAVQAARTAADTLGNLAASPSPAAVAAEPMFGDVLADLV